MSKPVAKGRIRFSESMIDSIVKALEMGGTDADAATVVGIERGTIYRWYKKYPELKAKADAAKAGYLASQANGVFDKLEECRILAEDYVLKLLKGEVERVKTRTDAAGVVLFKDTEVVLPSDRLVERFLQLGAGEQNFNLTIGLADPGDDYDDDDKSLDE